MSAPTWPRGFGLFHDLLLNGARRRNSLPNLPHRSCPATFPPTTSLLASYMTNLSGLWNPRDLILLQTHFCFSVLLTFCFFSALLRSQLIAAIGKEVSIPDLDEYMIYHYRKLFNEQFQPKKFCYPIRTEGTVPNILSTPLKARGFRVYQPPNEPACLFSLLLPPAREPSPKPTGFHFWTNWFPL